MVNVLDRALKTRAAGDWAEVRDHMRETLSPDERLMLAASAFQACLERDQMELIAWMAPGAEEPLPPMFGDGNMTEAREWASFASPLQHRAYAAACYEHLSARDRVKFAEWMEKDPAVPEGERDARWRNLKGAAA